MFKTWIFQLFILLVILVLFTSQPVKNPKEYYIKGGNVCPKTTYESRNYQVSQVSHFMETRKTSCGLFGWARCTIRRKATKMMYVIRTGTFAVTQLHCCPGWRSKKSIGAQKVCDKPICKLGCGPNGGKCVAPDTCKCEPGWTGTFCERDINECDQNNGNCLHTCTNKPGSYECGCNKGYVKHKFFKNLCTDLDECNYQKDPRACRCANIKEAECNATCINEIGSYRCTCNKGYRLTASTVCEDIDECLSPTTNNCNLKCLNLPGSYSCHCPKGFLLGKDGSTCEDEDECKTRKGCQHRCLNTYGSFRCRCHRGYRSHPNGRQCIDIDECQLLSNPCEMKCIDLMGSYRCSCQDGYKLNNDNFTCSDIDECRSGNTSLSDCEQLCTNTKGSFMCSCKRGYRLQRNQKACEDVDECLTGTHKCDQKCQNIIGSYICFCGPGYKLKADKKKCQALPCESIESPPYGNMKCDGFSTGSKCTFKCDPEYELLGSEESTCLPSGKWNGTRVECKVKRCPRLVAQENAEVLLPCHNTIRSKCILECLDGFHSAEGGTATCELDSVSGFGEWNFKNFQCEELRLCSPNPCLNGGKCSIQNKKEFDCDCEGTGFEGPRCETGVITTPTYQRLKAKQESKVYHLYARPKNELRVTIRSTQAILVKPQSELRLSKVTRQATFTLLPKKPGMHIIAYSLSGDDKDDFKVPAENTIFVGPDSVGKDNAYNTLQISKGSLPEGCHELPKSLFQCSAHLTSTFPWGTPSATSTEGIVHLQTKNFKIPISLFGADVNELSQTRDNVMSKIEETSLQAVPAGTDFSFVRDGKCHSASMKKDYLFEFIQNDALPRSIFRTVSSILPPWIQFQLDQSNDAFDVTNLMINVGKPISDGSGMCEQLPISSSSIFFKPTIAMNTKIGDETNVFKPKERVCLAIDVCQSKSFMDLSSQARKRLQDMKIFKDMKRSGWDFQVSSIGIQNQKSEEAVGKNNFDLWIRGETKVRMTGSRVVVLLNNTGEIFTKSDCPQELLSNQFTCSIFGSAKGRTTMQATLNFGDSKLIPLKLKSENMEGRFLFGGNKCYQGINVTLTSSENPVKGTMLSQFILPYLKDPMNVTIGHDIGGGGQGGVKIPQTLATPVLLLGFIMQQYQFVAPSISNMIPTLSSDANKLLDTVNDVKAQTPIISQLVSSSKGKTLVNQEAQNAIHTIKNLNEKIESILTMTTTLSQKLSSHASKPMVSGIAAQLPGLKSSLELAAKSLKLDVERSPVQLSLKEVSIGMMSQVCVARLCVPYVKTIILASNNDATTICPRKNANVSAFTRVLILPSKNVKLGRLLKVKEGEELTIDVSQKLLRLKTTISLFGMTKTVNLNITDQQLHAKVRGHIFNRFESEINVTANTKAVDGWESLVFKASGKIDEGSRLPRMLENSINQYAIKLAHKANNRIRKAKTVLESAINKTKDANTTFISKRKSWELSKKNKNDLENRLKEKTLEFNEFFLRFEDAVRDHDKFTKELLSKSCNFTECKRLCSKTCIPDMCWDKAVVQYQKHDCKKVNVPYIKSVPGTMTRTVEYPTTPMIRRDIGKCKGFFTVLGEGLIKGGLKLALTSIIGRRKKRSITDRQVFQNIPDFNRLLRTSNPNLPRDFDINVELRNLSGKLPDNFDINTVLASYFAKQHKFDPSKILKKQFPALPPDFDFDEEVRKALPELRNDFDFDQSMKDALLNAQRLKRRANFQKQLVNRIPELRNTDLDRVFKKFSPPLRSLNNITGQIQSSLDDALSFKVNNALLDRFDVNDIIKTKLRGLHRDVDLNKLLKQGIPQLGENFNLNKVLSDAVRLYPENLGDLNLNKLVKGAMGPIPGIPSFDLQKKIQNLVPGFAKGLNFQKLIQNKMQDMVSVVIDPLKVEKLNFNDIIRKQLPLVKELNINDIFKGAFKSVGGKTGFTDIIKAANPLLNMAEDFNVNNIVKGVLPGKVGNFDIGGALANNIPALLGGGQFDLNGILERGLNDFMNPKLGKILDFIPSINKITPFLNNLNLGDTVKTFKDMFSGKLLGNIGGKFQNFANTFAGSPNWKRSWRIPHFSFGKFWV